jgi:hypothetical protein
VVVVVVVSSFESPSKGYVICKKVSAAMFVWQKFPDATATSRANARLEEPITENRMQRGPTKCLLT